MIASYLPVHLRPLGGSLGSRTGVGARADASHIVSLILEITEYSHE